MSRPNSHIFAALEERDEPAAPVPPSTGGWHCPVPGCREPRPKGRNPIFCALHHFQLPYATTNFLFRWQLRCEREPDPEVRAFMLRDQARDIAYAVRELTGQAVH